MQVDSVHFMKVVTEVAAENRLSMFRVFVDNKELPYYASKLIDYTDFNKVEITDYFDISVKIEVDLRRF